MLLCKLVDALRAVVSYGVGRVMIEVKIFLLWWRALLRSMD